MLIHTLLSTTSVLSSRVQTTHLHTLHNGLNADLHMLIHCSQYNNSSTSHSTVATTVTG